MEYEEKVAVSISDAWWYGAVSEHIQLQLTFRLTSDGSAFDLRLTEGLLHPLAIESAIDAILFAMPFELPPSQTSNQWIITCDIKGNSHSPTTTIKYSEHTNEESEFQKNIEQPSLDQASRKDFEPWLLAVCENLFNFPDSEHISEVESVLRSFHPEYQTSSLWFTLATGWTNVLLLSRPPEAQYQDDFEYQTKNWKPSIAALFQAWRTTHASSILYELSRVYSRKIADDLSLTAPTTLSLATMDVLREQYESAKVLYKSAANDEIRSANKLLDSLSGTTYGTSQRRQYLETDSEPLKPSDWKSLLKWFPPFINRIVKAGPIGHIEPYDEVGWNVGKHFIGGTIGLPGFGYEKVQQILKSSFIDLAMSGSRAYSFGYGANVIVFRDDEVSIRLMDIFREGSASRQFFENVEVLAFEVKESAPWFLDPHHLTYLCSPCAGVLVSARGKHFLRELLNRIVTEPTDQAFPVEWSIWKDLNTTSDIWALRALLSREAMNGTDMPDYFHGAMFFELPGDRVCIKFLSSDENTIRDKASRWRVSVDKMLEQTGKTDYFEGALAFPPGEYKFTVEDNAVTLHAKTSGYETSRIALLALEQIGLW